MKLTKNSTLTALCETAKRYVLSKAPENEYQLIEAMKKYFTGFSLKQGKKGYFTASAEIIVTDDGLTGFVGDIKFTVPTCKTAYTRDENGYILNMNEFKTTTE